MAHIRVIGIGNDARGDDAVGLVVARQLQPSAPEGVTVQEICGDGMSLLDQWSGADAVILIDATYSGAIPGSIHRLKPLVQPMPKELYLCSTHAFGVGQAIELARALQQLPPHLVVYGIEGAQFEMGDEMSEDVQQAIPEVVRQARRDIATFQSQTIGDWHHA